MKNAGITKGVQVNEGGLTYILWSFLLPGIGGLVAIAKFLKNYNNLVTVSNYQTADRAS